MASGATRCLVVDDDRLNRQVVVANLRAAGYETVIAEDGVDGWTVLDTDPDGFDVVLLDRRMPRLDGMGLLAKMKADPRLKSIPVIMQTAHTSTNDVVDGVKAGVFYYLGKPFDRQLLLSVTAAAVEDHRRDLKLRRDLEKHGNALVLMEYGRFCFRTMEEANALAVSLAQGCPRPENLVMGFSELFTNAIEHGNLGINYQEKSVMVAQGRWQQEIEDRLNAPENRTKQVLVTFQRSDDGVRVSIRDEGPGFDWRKYMDFDPARAFSVHGRGIAMARKLSFDDLIYNETGNEVTCVIRGKTDGLIIQPQNDGAPLPKTAHQEQPDPIAPMPPPAASNEEMESARTMQKELLPRQAALSWIERRYPIKISAYFETSSVVGGDLWGIDQLDEHHFTLWLADFSGHGVAAALNTFRLHTMIEHVSTERNRPAAYLAEVNQRLVGLLPTGQYATMIYGMLNVQTGMFTYAAAAAPKPLSVGPDGVVTLGDGSGLPLGVSRASRYADRTLQVPDGGVLFLASDALLEIPTSPDNKPLGWAGVSNLLSGAMQNHGAKVDVNSILTPFLDSVQHPLRDDLTAVCCRRPSP